MSRPIEMFLQENSAIVGDDPVHLSPHRPANVRSEPTCPMEIHISHVPTVEAMPAELYEEHQQHRCGKGRKRSRICRVVQNQFVVFGA